jgi:hypothetical protein
MAARVKGGNPTGHSWDILHRSMAITLIELLRSEGSRSDQVGEAGPCYRRPGVSN